MMTKPIRPNSLIKAVTAVALCSTVIFAQQAGDWFAGEPVQQGHPPQAAPAQPAHPAPAPAAAHPAPAVQPAPVAHPAPAPAAEQAVHAPEADEAAASVPSTGIIDAESTRLEGTIISREALISAPYLHMDRNTRPGEGKVMSRKDRTLFQKYDKVTVKPSGKKKFGYKEGDTVDVIRRVRSIAFRGKPVQLTARVGRGVVVGYAGDRAVVQLKQVWGPISGGESIDKAVSVEPVHSGRLSTSAWGSVKATVAFRIDRTATPYLHQYLIIDKGSGAGVKIGDYFRVKEKAAPNKLSERVLEGQVVSMTQTSATLIIQKLHIGHVAVGDEVFLSFRAQ